MRDLALVAFIAILIPYILRQPWLGVVVGAWISLMNPHRYAFGFANNFPFALIIALLTVAAVVFGKKKVEFPRHSVMIMILLSGFYTPGFEGDGIVLTQNSLAAVVGDWGRMFVSVALSLFVFTCILYNYYLGENSLQFLTRNRAALMTFRGLVLALVVWGSMQDLSTVFAFADITMTCLAFVNLMALALLFKVGMRVMRDYDAQRRAGVDQPVFDSSKFSDLDLDLKAWPANPTADTQANAQPQGIPAAQR